jgi:hypothetical protein
MTHDQLTAEGKADKLFDVLTGILKKLEHATADGPAEYDHRARLLLNDAMRTLECIVGDMVVDLQERLELHCALCKQIEQQAAAKNAAAQPSF